MSRFVIYGAGAIGGVMGARLHASGYDVLLIARSAHHDAIAAHGLKVESPRGIETLAIQVVDSPAKANLSPGDIVMLTMKSQDTAVALRALRDTAPPETPIVCAQNGLENERAALRCFAHVHGMFVHMPTSHTTPGLVVEHGADLSGVPHPVPGILDVGRYPAGTDGVDEHISEALTSAGFLSLLQSDIMAWKRRKLVQSVGTAVNVLLGPPTGAKSSSAPAPRRSTA